MNRKYKIILGVVCVALSIFLGYLRLTAGADEEVFTSGSAGAPNDEHLTTGEVVAEVSNPTQGTERIAAGSTGAYDLTSYTPGSSESVGTFAAGEIAENTDSVNTDDAAEMPPEDLVVHVCGCVNSPGVYRLEPGSRIIEAVEKAGGFTGDADNSVINLADRLADGMQIYVPALSESVDGSGRQYVREASNVGAGADSSADTTAGTGAVSNAGALNAGSGKVNINTAGKEELMTLNGVGASRADAIIAYRTENGRFASIEEIMNISGIKDGLFGKIKDKITVE